ncbi:iron ABC transporter substrate-binding protein [Aggregatibacter actinomycetemcomitans]|nr:iron ABC transporter substrate-binding protein [Aggregatibacter actinomycetemcomitans]
MNIMTPNWAIAATLTEIGQPPVAMEDKRVYPQWVSQPVQPDSVIDMGPRYQPNRELLEQIPISHIMQNFFYSHLRDIYPSHIPVTDILFDGGNTETYQRWQTYVNAAKQIGVTIRREKAVDDYLHQVEQQLARYGADIRRHHAPIEYYAVVQFGSAKELRIYSTNSLFSVAFQLMGLKQATLGLGNRWGNRLIRITELAKLPPNTCLLIIEPFSLMTETELTKSYVWNRLGFGKTRCMYKLPSVWLFGGPESIAHFSRFLHEAVMREGRR